MLKVNSCFEAAGASGLTRTSKVQVNGSLCSSIQPKLLLSHTDGLSRTGYSGTRYGLPWMSILASCPSDCALVRGQLGQRIGVEALVWRHLQDNLDDLATPGFLLPRRSGLVQRRKGIRTRERGIDAKILLLARLVRGKELIPIVGAKGGVFLGVHGALVPASTNSPATINRRTSQDKERIIASIPLDTFGEWGRSGGIKKGPRNLF